MKVVPTDPGVKLYEDGFEEQDLLQRKRLGHALSDILNRVDDPLVIALDGRWGTGKTYFLKRWVGEHARMSGSAAVVYFDAFAHDHLGDPLPALVSALEGRVSGLGADIPAECEKNIQAMKEAVFRLAKPAARAAAAAVGASAVLNAIDEFAKAREDEHADSLDRFWEAEEGRRISVEIFRSAIESLAATVDGEGTGSTVVIVVDELDRCRPDYALEVLEVIKHFFTVPRLHFVLGVNLEALEDMVQARYGSGIDAHAYLAKFIQMTLNLPDEFSDDTNRQKQAVMAYLDHLVGDIGITQQIAETLRSQIAIVSRANQVSLRDVGNIVSSLSLANVDVAENPDDKRFMPGYLQVMIDLVVSRTVRHDLHQKFLDATVTPADLESYLGATGNMLDEHLGGQPNPAYDPQISLKYHTWLYLARNGEIKNGDPEILKLVPKQFDEFGRIGGDPRSLPMMIHRLWLDRFSFYGAV